MFSGVRRLDLRQNKSYGADPGYTVRHFHIHIVPKYADGLDWNGIFQMNANAKYPEEKDLEAAAKQLREEISGE